MSVTTNKYRIGMSGDPANNFDLEPDGAGSLLIKRVSTGDVVGRFGAYKPVFRATGPQQAGFVNNSWVKVGVPTEEIDTTGALTNGRFQPNIAGWYSIGGSGAANGSAGLDYATAAIYKNGVSSEAWIGAPYSGTSVWLTIDTLVYLNGSTDYVELYARLTATSGTLVLNTPLFRGFLVEAE